MGSIRGGWVERRVWCVGRGRKELEHENQMGIRKRMGNTMFKGTEVGLMKRKDRIRARAKAKKVRKQGKFWQL